jgi:transcription initiation factor TFIIIB Brf1 subunit/transcription initiation factor TFIIB
MADYVCPECGSTDIKVFYTGPLTFECKGCGVRLKDENCDFRNPMSTRDSMEKRPRMYGLPCCAYCFHAPHGATCRFCDEKNKPHVYRLVKA